MIIKAGFIGAGGIAHSHAYALQALKFYYRDAPDIVFESVCSLRKESRDSFAERYLFGKSQTLEEFVCNREINTILIIGPNKTHFEHFRMTIEM